MFSKSKRAIIASCLLLGALAISLLSGKLWGRWPDPAIAAAVLICGLVALASGIIASIKRLASPLPSAESPAEMALPPVASPAELAPLPVASSTQSAAPPSREDVLTAAATRERETQELQTKEF